MCESSVVRDNDDVSCRPRFWHHVNDNLMTIQIEIPVNEESAPLLQQLEITDVSWYVTLFCPLATLHTTHTTHTTQ